MANLNINEYGQKVYVNLGEDISSATGLTFFLEPQNGEKLTRGASDGVAVGSTTITVDDESFTANQYLEYTIKSGDLNHIGQWRLTGQVDQSPTIKVISDYRQIEVR